MTAGRLLMLGALALIPAAAQAQAPGPPGPYAVDLRVAMSALPQDPAFFPPVPTATLIPTRSLGIDAGGHVYFFGLGPARLGLGASLLRVRGHAEPERPTSSSSSSTTTPPTRPDVDTVVTAIAPQLSLNFGSSTGWSYISAGVGQTRVKTITSTFVTGSGSSARTTPERTLDLRGRQTINVGGGARWFMTGHIAFSFDVRFHLMSARATEEGRTPKTTLVAASAGLSFR